MKLQPLKSHPIVTVLAVAVLLVSACSSTKSDTEASVGTSDTKVDLTALYKGDYTDAPSTSPAPAKDKNVFIVSCGQGATSCSGAVGAASEAATKLGWKPTVFDSQGDFSTVPGAIDQALGAGTDAIFVYGVDCSSFKQSAIKAQRAGVPVVVVEAVDCAYGETGADPLTSGIVYSGNRTFAQYIKDWGKAHAEYVLATRGSKSKVLNFYDTNIIGTKEVVAGIDESFKGCSSCQVTDVSFPYADLFAGTFQQKAEQAVLRNPDANAITMPYDTVISGGLNALLRSNAQVKQMTVVAGEGSGPVLDLIRNKGGVAAAVGLVPAWEGYAAIDSLNRLLQGQKPVDSGIGFQLIDASHNLPASGEYQPPVDFRAQYAKAWGVN